MVLEIPPADERLDHRHDHGLLADAAGGCRTGRRRQGQGRQISDHAAGLHRAGAGRLHRPAVADQLQGYALLRSILKSDSDADVAEAVAYGKQIKLYPLSQAANPPATVFVDAIDVVFDATIPYDVRFFQSLDRMVQARTLARPRQGDDRPAQVGRHREGQAVSSPTPQAERILNAAAAEAQALLADEYQSAFSLPPSTDGGQWGRA